MHRTGCACALAAGLLMCACAPGKTKSEPAATEAPVLAVLAEATATPETTPLPTGTAELDMVFDDSGNIAFSDAFAATFTTGTFSFDRAPRVLIYHTHARESFREEGAADASASAGARKPGGRTGSSGTAAPANPEASASPSPAPQSRSLDNTKNVVRLGALLADELTRRGFTVFHDETDVEDPSLSTAYTRSREVMTQYEDIDLYIDLHRNAADAARARNDVVTLNGERTARLFFVVGTGITADGTENELAAWRQNYTLARSLTAQLASVDPALVKPVRVKQGTYNQDLGLCLLAEIGHNANLLSDAEHTIPRLADALAAVLVFPTA